MPYLRHLSAGADRLLLVVAAVLVVISLLLALRQQLWLPLLAVALPALAVATVQARLHPGTRLSSCTIAMALMVLSATLIHQSHGLPESHFGVILLIALLLCYRDWLPIVVAAGTIAVHHVAFFWLQQRGLPVAVFGDGSGLGTLALHAAYVVAEAVVLVVMAVQMRRQLDAIGHDPAELAAISRALAANQRPPAHLLEQRMPSGSLAESMLAMAAELTRRDADSSRVARENLRVRTALDSVTTNVMIADSGRNIVYANKPLVAMLRAAEADLRRDLPSFSVDTMIGANIDGFHKRPEHQARMLAELDDTFSTQIRVGGRVMRLVINPILDAERQRQGFVVEWADRTGEVEVEQELTRIVAAAAAGDLSGRVATEGKQGFLLQLAQQLNALLDANSVSLAEVSRLLTALSDGDLTARMQGEFHGVFAGMRDDANATAERLTGIVGQIQQASAAIGTASAEIAAGNNDLSRRTEQQAANLEETAASMEELTSTVRQNAEHARQANQLAASTAEGAIQGGALASRASQTMVGIEASSRRIADIISVIDGIAFQTNILALNAAVEAARAGEQGRGFAVVATEVRSLAQRSATAAKEIKTLIEDSVERVTEGSVLVGNANTTMADMAASIQRLAAIMAEIAAASQEQAAGIEQVNQTILQMDEATQQNAALVEEASATARSMEDQAQGLVAAISVFRTGAPGDGGPGGQPQPRRLRGPTIVDEAQWARR
ncbi:methyl-accepting chemotaxis protein [Xanthomonas sp. XNM01]|nr:methyl-accepting chemotaxis protein [Xanthomonas sp. XNM01]